MQGLAEESEAPETIWIESDKMVSCVPRELNLGESLQVKLGEHHSKELAVYRHEENLWLFFGCWLAAIGDDFFNVSLGV